jgi:hypothetical protein
LLVCRNVFFCINRVDRTFWNAYSAVNAFIRVNCEEIRAFAKAIDGTHIYTISVFTLDAGFGDNVRHGDKVL